MKGFIKLLATWGGTGFSPIASGTVGTLGAIPFFLLLSRLSLPLYLVTLVAFFFLASWVAGRAEHLFGEHDSGKIVIDEVVGYLVTMTAVPVTYTTVAAGFLLFRFFDVVKVEPARSIDRRMTNGYGVVLDDVVAGLYSCVVLHLAVRLM
jgi:phosphatidylglycerophosphatase A